jgi:hypothetical protein
VHEANSAISARVDRPRDALREEAIPLREEPAEMLVTDAIELRFARDERRRAQPVSPGHPYPYAFDKLVS